MGGWARVILLSVGGVAGVNARYFVALWMKNWTNPHFPWATFTINVTGSFAVGVVATLLDRWLPHPNARTMIVTGFLGGYTTFSAYAYEAGSLWTQGPRGRVFALIYASGSVLAGVLAVFLGIALAQWLNELMASGRVRP